MMPLESDFVEFFKGFSNANRQAILFHVFVDKKEHTVAEVAEKVGIAVSTASEHLTLLKKAGILVSEKRSKEVFYKVNKENISLFLEAINQWLHCC